MKQSLKYGLLLLLTLLIHSVSNQTMENNSEEATPTTYSQEECFVSQGRPIRNALERLYSFYSTQSCDLSHTDITHVPAEKSVQLLVSYCRGHKPSPKSSYDFSYHIPKYLSDPITHYIYGLRKIII